MTEHGPDLPQVVDRPDRSDRPDDGPERRPLSWWYIDDPDDIFRTADTPELPDRPDHTPEDYTAEARALARRLGFDPHTHTRPLGDHHHPGVHDPVRWPPGTSRHPHELRTATLLATEGSDVRLGPEDHAQDGVTHVDSIVRYTPDDPGTLTELKALLNPHNVPAAIKNHVAKAVKQLEPHVASDGHLLDGHVVVDGRACGLTEADVHRGCLRLVGQANAHGQRLPRRIRFILGDGTSRFYEPTVSMNHTGTTRFDRPDERTLRTADTTNPGNVHERH